MTLGSLGRHTCDLQGVQEVILLLDRSLMTEGSLWYASGLYLEYVRLGIPLVISRDGPTLADTGLWLPTIWF